MREFVVHVDIWYKEKVDFKEREDELKKLLDKHRSNSETYDCVVPSSGGKDSAYVAHELKYKYGMNPLRSLGHLLNIQILVGKI